MRRPCLRFEMARSLLAAVFFAEAFAIVAGEGEGDVAIVGNHQRSCLPPHTNHTLVWSLLTLPPTNSLFFLHRRFEVQARHATPKHAQLRPSLKVRRKVTHPFSPARVLFLAALSFWPGGVSIPARLLSDSSAYLPPQAVLYHLPRSPTQTPTPQHLQLRVQTSPHPGHRTRC